MALGSTFLRFTSQYGWEHRRGYTGEFGDHKLQAKQYYIRLDMGLCD